MAIEVHCGTHKSILVMIQILNRISHPGFSSIYNFVKSFAKRSGPIFVDDSKALPKLWSSTPISIVLKNNHLLKSSHSWWPSGVPTCLMDCVDQKIYHIPCLRSQVELCFFQMNDCNCLEVMRTRSSVYFFNLVCIYM